MKNGFIGAMIVAMGTLFGVPNTEHVRVSEVPPIENNIHVGNDKPKVKEHPHFYGVGFAAHVMDGLFTSAGLGYRNQWEKNGLDVALTVSTRARDDKYPIPRISYLRYSSDNGGFYGGIGLFVLMPIASVGYQLSWDGGPFFFIQFDTTIPGVADAISIGMGF